MSTVSMVALALALSQAPAQPAAQPAQPAAQPAVKLTLAEALDAAEKRNLDMKAALAALDQADEISAQAWSYQLPQVKASAQAIRNNKAAFIPGGVFGPDYIPIVPLHAQQAKIEASQVLFAPSLWFSIRSAHRAEDSAVAQLEGARRAIRFGVAQAYYGVAATAKAVSASERLLEIAQRQEKDAKVRFDAGTIAKVGLLRAEIDRARAEQDLKRARNSHESMRITLASLLDRPVDFEIVEPPEPTMPGDAGALEARALAERPEVAAARATVDANRASRNAAWAEDLPTVAAFGQHSWSNSAGLTGGAETWLIGLSASWNLLDGGLRESKIRQNGAKLDEAEARLKKAENQVRDDVRQALLDLDSARANAAKSKEQRDLAAENQRLVDVSYKAGAATAVEQADATAQLRTAEFGAQADELSARIAALKVQLAVGAKAPVTQ